jgi:hypothetical protein
MVPHHCQHALDVAHTLLPLLLLQGEVRLEAHHVLLPLPITTSLTINVLVPLDLLPITFVPRHREGHSLRFKRMVVHLK